MSLLEKISPTVDQVIRDGVERFKLDARELQDVLTEHAPSFEGCPHGELRVLGNSDNLSLCLGNLLHNAYTAWSKCTVNERPSHPEVLITCHPEGNEQVVIKVYDNIPGEGDPVAWLNGSGGLSEHQGWLLKWDGHLSFLAFDTKTGKKCSVMTLRKL